MGRAYVSPKMSRKTFYNECTRSDAAIRSEYIRQEREAYEYQVRKHGEPEQDWSKKE